MFCNNTPFLRFMMRTHNRTTNYSESMYFLNIYIFLAFITEEKSKSIIVFSWKHKEKTEKL